MFSLILMIVAFVSYVISVILFLKFIPDFGEEIPPTSFDTSPKP